MAIRTKEDLRELPVYSVSEAAHYLRMPKETLRSWIHGRPYKVSGQTKQSRPLIHLHDRNKRYLSFINFVEAHVLAAIRRHHGIQLPKVRRALDYVREQWKEDRPLITQVFQTDGLDLFVEHYGDLINVSREGQRAMKDIIGLYLKRIERDRNGVPVKLFPFTRDTQIEGRLASDPRIIVMNPAVSFGRPVIVGTGIPVASIFERYKAGDSIAELARDFHLEGDAVEEAIRCEAA